MPAAPLLTHDYTPTARCAACTAGDHTWTNPDDEPFDDTLVLRRWYCTCQTCPHCRGQIVEVFTPYRWHAQHRLTGP
ncbi:hypothetical protein [Alloactinosynnema sp. L-07]|uniref:hypothetical protein n=1 Tax=Alloactinosynnema sp. L-07 TaxID=1653480 RepID=UPI00065F07FD|nr:hypothetical protein [Alloactinosynnema sp. L-07]CRK61693.1 hypothetical protein [Alloactinosynnema sp. L-07]